MSYSSFADTTIYGWYMVPCSEVNKKWPCMVIFHGYGSDRGIPEDYAIWTSMGIAVLTLDTRGQVGETGNLLPLTSGMTRGWVSQNILVKESSYFQALCCDVVRALDWVSEQPEIDTSRVGVFGTSQGGGMALLASSLSSIPVAVAANVPNMCHMDFGIFHSVGSLSEIAQFALHHPESLRGILHNLSYFDNMNHAHRIHIPVLMSVGLKDTICFPEMVYAAFNHLESNTKRIATYPFMGHENGGSKHGALVYDFFIEHLRV